MPIIVSQSLASASPLDQDGTKAVGLAYPLVLGSTGLFKQTFTTPEAIRNNLINLLLTKIGERPMVPDFGSKLHTFIFEPVSNELADDIRDAVLEAVSKWMPYVNIVSVVVSDKIDKANIYLLEVAITYFVPNIAAPTKLNLLIEN